MGFVVTLILYAVFLLLSELLKPKSDQEQRRPADLGDFSFPTATEGRPIPILWGTCKVAGPNVVWYGDLKQEAIVEKVKTGLFSSKKVVKGYKYHLGIQMAICRGPIDSIQRIWVDDEEFYTTAVSTDSTVYFDNPDWFGGIDQGAGGIVGNVTFRMGSSGQTAVPYLSSFQAISGTTPAYRGTCHVTLERVYLGTSTSIRPWAFEVRRIPNGLGLGTPSVNSGNDANPMNVIYEIMTNTEWGLGLPSSDINTAAFIAAADTLRTEGNGISMVLDNQREAYDLLNEIQRQIDGVVFLDRSTGEWTVKLARADYNINNVPLIDESKLVSVSSFSRGAWDETINVYLVSFNNRAREYQQTYALAQDMANVRIQVGQIVKAEVRYPGVKDPDLANQIAWRELRNSSMPLAKAKLVVDRTFYNVNPGDVLAWSDDDLGFTRLPLRVTRADFGEIDKGQITLDLVQDIYSFAEGSYAPPQAGNWTPPTQTVVDINSPDRKAFEAPLAFVARDPESPGLVPRIWTGFRYQNDGAVTVTVRQDSNQVELGTVGGFLLAGTLISDLPAAHATAGTLVLEASPDLKAQFLDQIESVTVSDIGNSLANVILINGEFMAFTSVSSSSGSNIQLNGLVRNLFDSVTPAAGHTLGDRVWFISIAGSLSDSAFGGSGSVTFRPIPESPRDILDWASATSTTVSLDSRHLRPYPPVNPRTGASSTYNGTFSIDTNSVVTGRTGVDAKGMLFSFTRRDYRVSDEYSKIVNESSLLADFPAANSTEYRLAYYDGSGTYLCASEWSNVNNPNVPRNQILASNGGVLPATLDVRAQTRHTVDGTVYTAQQEMGVLVTPTSEVSGWTSLGAIQASTWTSAWTLPVTGTYTVSIATELPNGHIEKRTNGGSSSVIISGNQTSHNFSGTAGDTVDFLHTATATPDDCRFVTVTPPSGSPAFFVLII